MSAALPKIFNQFSCNNFTLCPLGIGEIKTGPPKEAEHDYLILGRLQSFSVHLPILDGLNLTAEGRETSFQ